MNLNNEQRLNLLVSAIEGGSNYWYHFGKKADQLIHKYGQADNISFAEKLFLAINAGEIIPIHDIETNEEIGELSLDSIKKGEGIMLCDYPAHLGISAETVKGVETGRFACDIDLLFKFCEALEIKPFFTLLEELGKGSAPSTAGEKFLLCPDETNEQLYILHREYPACLILVVQTVPVMFKIVDLYDDIEEGDLAIHPFWEDAKAFWREKAGNNESNN